MRLNKQDVRDLDISSMKEYVSDIEKYQVDMNAGQEGYKLYTYLSSMFDGIRIAELGTRYATSSVMLATNPVNEVDTYDVHKYTEYPKLDNLKCHIRDMFLDENIHELLDYKIIFLDVGEHESILEEKLYNYLVENEWNGILVCSAIGPTWPALNNWWNSLPEDPPKYDVTDIGHAAGTGIVDFSRELKIIDTVEPQLEGSLAHEDVELVVGVGDRDNVLLGSF